MASCRDGIRNLISGLPVVLHMVDKLIIFGADLIPILHAAIEFPHEIIALCYQDW